MQVFIFILASSFFLIILRNLFLRYNILLDNPDHGNHKIYSTKGTPLLGGVFFYVIILSLILFYNFSHIDIKLFLFLFILLVLGFFADLKKTFSPNARLVLQLLLVISIVLFFDVRVERTTIPFLDFLISNNYIKIFFTIFCILIVINGSNFIDGFNGVASGYFLLSFIFIYTLSIKETNITFNDLIFLKMLILAFLIFYVFNLLGKCFFGDNGIYLVSAFLSIYLITFLGKNSNISPIYAVNILWYPAFENLFSIIRRLKYKKLLTYPDQMHLHSNLNKFILKKFNFPKKLFFKNSLTGIIINIIILPSFIVGLYFFDNSMMLGILTLVNIIVYLTVYFVLSTKYEK